LICSDNVKILEDVNNKRQRYIIPKHSQTKS